MVRSRTLHHAADGRESRLARGDLGGAFKPLLAAEAMNPQLAGHLHPDRRLTQDLLQLDKARKCL